MAAFAPTGETPSPDIVISEEWSVAAATIAKSFTKSMPPVVFICGPKNSGKTTFSRYLLTTFLPRYKSVAYLDMDVGQPVFTPPGFLSLTVVDKKTPDIFHLNSTTSSMKTPQRCYFFGDVSSKRDPEAYLNCIYALYDHYRKDLRISCKNGSPGAAELPLIINTPGWVKGLGYDMLVDILKYIAATHVVKINISDEKKDLPSGTFWLDDLDECSVNLLEITAVSKDSHSQSRFKGKEARRDREQRLMGYFRQCFPRSTSTTTQKELALALSSLTPYQVPISSIKIKHLHCEVPNSEVFYSLNATIVGLAVSCKDAQSLPACVGLGIVRGIDTSKNVIYLITPVPLNILAGVDLLLQGCIQIPTDLLQVQGCMSPYMSANVIRLAVEKCQSSGLKIRNM